MSDTETDTLQRKWYTVTCYDHAGSYYHLNFQTPEKCQHCGSYNIEVNPGRQA